MEIALMKSNEAMRYIDQAQSNWISHFNIWKMILINRTLHRNANETVFTKFILFPRSY